MKDQEVYKGELELSRGMIDDFKKNFEKAERQIKKLEIQNALVNEEKHALVKINQ